MLIYTHPPFFLIYIDVFDRGLKNVIDSFERAREWADLSNCLQRVRKQIENNKGLPIPRQRDLAKRLSKFYTLIYEFLTIIFFLVNSLMFKS